MASIYRPKTMIGHLDGLPKITDPNVREQSRLVDGTRFLSADQFHGNSGSEVINSENGKVFGMTFSSRSDYVKSQEYNGECSKFDSTRLLMGTQETM